MGKTTLAKKLLKHPLLQDHVYAHFSRLPPGFDYYWDYLDRASVRVVQDRFHMSEPVYAKARGDQTRLTPEVYRLVDARLRLLGSYTVVITADPALIRTRWREGEMYPIDKVLSVNQMFMQIVSREFSDYTPDFDYYFHGNHARPYVTDAAVGDIVAGYLKRLEAIREVVARKPALP